MIGAFGGFFLVSLLFGVVRVRQGRIDQHRAWMIRAFAIGLSVATMRLLFIPALGVIGDPTDAQIGWLSVASFAIAFCLHAGAAEWFIHTTRRCRLNQPRPLLELAFDRRNP